MAIQQIQDDITQSEETATAISNHIASSDDHTAYALLAGRAGGQTLYGGSASGNDLTLYSNTSSDGDVDVAGVLLCDEAASDGTFANDLEVTNDLDVGGAAHAPEIYGYSGAAGNLVIGSNAGSDDGLVTVGGVLVVEDDLDLVGIGGTPVNEDLEIFGNMICTGVAYGGDGSGDDLHLGSTTHATKDRIFLGASSAYDELNTRLGIGKTVPVVEVDVVGAVSATTDITAGDDITSVDDMICGGLMTVSESLAVGTTLNVTTYIHGKASSGSDLVIGSNDSNDGEVQIASALIVDENTGLVGINVTPVNEELTVNGDLLVEDYIYGGDAVADEITIYASSNAGRTGNVYVGGSVLTVKESSAYVGINQATSTGAYVFEVDDGAMLFSGNVTMDGILYLNEGAGKDSQIYANDTSDKKILIGRPSTLWIDEAEPATGMLHIAPDIPSGFVATFRNDGNNNNREGIDIWAGLDAVTPLLGDIVWARLKDGDGHEVARIESDAAGTNAQFTSGSDERLKENIRDTDVHGLEVINGLQLRQFDWKDETKPHQDIGFVAQEVMSAYPDMVGMDRETGYYRIGQSSLTPVLVKAVQELSAKVDELEARLGDCQ
jgi:hypothetical protein